MSQEIKKGPFLEQRGIIRRPFNDFLQTESVLVSFATIVLFNTNNGLLGWIGGKIADEVESRRANPALARHEGSGRVGIHEGKVMRASAAHARSHELLLTHGIMTPAMREGMEDKIANGPIQNIKINYDNKDNEDA